MRLYRMSFVTGLALGFVAGTRAGREKYDQMVKLAKSAADNPTVQQAAGAIQAQASTAAQKVGGQIHDKVPHFAQGAMHTVGDHIPGLKHRNSSSNGGNGASSGHPFAATSDTTIRPDGNYPGS